MISPRNSHIVLLLFCLLNCLPIHAEITSIAGMVVDAQTGERLPFVQIYFIKPSSEGSLATQYGTTSDMDGHFSLSNPVGYTTINFQMMGYKTEMYTLKVGQQRNNIKIKMQPDVYGLQDIVVLPKKRKQKYKRKGNPAVELIKNVIAYRDSFQVKTTDFYTADTYHRMSFAVDNFTPNFKKGFWKGFQFVEKYIDTTGVYPALTVSIRENLGHEFYQHRPHRERKQVTRQRVFGLESLLSTQSLENNMKSVFTDVDINDDNMNLLFNRFVSPISSSLAVSYYQYYIMDTIMIEGDSVIDLAFVPVNSESYSFTGHLYIMNDSTYKIKKYSINIPPHINLNFVSHYSVEHTNRRLENGLWAPERTNTYCKFYLTSRKRNLLARQTKLYTNFDFHTKITKEDFIRLEQNDTIKEMDTISIREDFRYWDEHRPEPMNFYESSVMNLVDEFKRTPKFNSMLMVADALMTDFLATVPSSRWGESKWDFGPIGSTVSWNKLEGARLRIGGTTTANLHPQLFLSGYVAFGTHDLRPKYKAELIWSFRKKRYHQYEPLLDYISLSAQYDVEEPAQQVGVFLRDNILMSIPTGKVVDRNEQYVFRTKVQYIKEFPIQLSLQTSFAYEYNEAAGAMHYDRISALDSLGHIISNETCYDKYHRNAYHCYEGCFVLRYAPGANTPINRYGVESPFTLSKDAPVISMRHWIGFLDDRKMLDANGIGGNGFFYNHTQLTAEKRFWFSSFGHLDARIQTGYIWNRVPFSKLYSPVASTSIFLGKNAFNQMQPTEFMFDIYLSLYATYYFKGWILNRIPGINRLKLRGVVSFSMVYGGLTKKNNPYLPNNMGLYALPNNLENLSYSVETNAKGQQMAYVTSGYTSSPIGKLPYMEITAGFENILRFFRIDYVRRLTYNEYELPFVITNDKGEMIPVRRKIGAWGRNGVKITMRFSL